MTRKAFLALCASVLAAPFVARKVVTAPASIVPKPPEPVKIRFKNHEIVFDEHIPKQTYWVMNTRQQEFYQRILNSEGERLYGLGTWETKQGDAN
jgi:hypothetical protein